MAKFATMDVAGLEELREMLRDFLPRESRNLLRATVHGVAGVARDRIQKAAPHRRLRKGFKAVRRRGEPNKPVSEVHSKPTAFMWRWFEYGTQPRRHKSGKATGRIVARPFVNPALERVRSEMPKIYREQFGKKLEQAVARKAKKRARAK